MKVGTEVDLFCKASNNVSNGPLFNFKLGHYGNLQMKTRLLYRFKFIGSVNYITLSDCEMASSIILSYEDIWSL